ncbi:hypothetical protein BCR33DRAFT_717522 [Rhizoclosmatium globosum]|uniref:Uncharacterized protein n=1 Tax=Rhizoclosmatium globosum TaxID=329046 RepID=A0A1Y2CAB4_9FUNG|nr:hypothetical protein BCR33DRAFT_717522 [Rhizoclosmatium globosum]|eukprot:ORY43275.1 hypothetical protein BCR33DRAFT_717522 [Rhizoclosmatium globosum]
MQYYSPSVLASLAPKNHVFVPTNDFNSSLQITSTRTNQPRKSFDERLNPIKDLFSTKRSPSPNPNNYNRLADE